MNTAPNERNPPGVAGFEGQHGHATGIARQAYRSRPREGTARAQVLEALEAGDRLTSLEAWQRFGTSRLAADVFELRRMGWPVVSEETPVRCREGRSARIATYRMANTAGGRQ